MPSKNTTTERWKLIHGDCVEELVKLKSESIDYSIFSPPFSSLYTYSDDVRDMGNSKTYEEFFEHFKFLTPELFRIIKPGRLVSFHCMNLPLLKERDGRMGIRDFRGHLIRVFEEAGFVYHSEVCIWKNPVTAMQRTKAIGLLHKQIKKDSCVSRQGIPDYLVTMRKDGINAKPVKGRFETWYGALELGPKNSKVRKPGNGKVNDDAEAFSIEVWQRYASPVWMDIDQSDTLQYTHVRGEKDERHICPLQLGVIRRGIEMWSNEGDLILSPFAGIGSEGYVALQEGRRFLGVELKEEYYKWALKNLAHAEKNAYRSTLFGPRRAVESRKALL